MLRIAKIDFLRLGYNLLRQNKSDSLEFGASMNKDSIAKTVIIMMR